MRPVSPTFLAAIRGSHTVTARATIVAPGQSGVSPTGTQIPIIDGDVVLDGTAQVRSTADVTTDGRGLWPVRITDLFAPYGAELFLERGIALGGGTSEWCSLGYFPIRTIDQDTPPNGAIRIEAKDRMQGIVDARLLKPLQFPATRTYGEVVDRLVLEVYPDAEIEWDDTTYLSAIGRALITEDKRFEFLDNLVSSRGKIWYWDYRGVLMIRDLPDVNFPVWDVNAGENGVLVSSTRQLSREGVYNAVVASGEATDTQDPVRGVAFDADPASPTYYRGRFGPVPKFFTSSFLATNVQAATAAAAELRKCLGLPYSLDLTAIPNPALEPWDPITVRIGPEAVPETHVLEKITVPLTAESAMTASTREQTRALIDIASD